MSDNGTRESQAAGRPVRILLCPDRPDWAFDHIADQIIRFAPERLRIGKFFLGHAGDRDLSRFYEHVATHDVDIVHFFWREDLFELIRPPALLAAADRLGVTVADIAQVLAARALTTSVYDHLFLSEAQVAERIGPFGMIDAYSVSSHKLHRIYASEPGLPSPDAVITDGVDLARFAPREGLARAVDRPVIGWVGNSAWGRSQGEDPKGFHRLFKPALEMLGQRGLSFEVRVADPQVSRVPFDEMPEFYRSIDVLACTSSMEGTPNPVLEAAASGVPVVSTDVGIVRELFGPMISEDKQA